MIGSRAIRRRRRRPRATIAIAAATIAVAGTVAWLAVTAERGLPGVPHYDLRVEFDDLSNLRDNDDVRIAGRRVGQVLDPRVEEGRSVADLQLDEGVGPLPADTTAVVRARGLLGARFLELSPGRSRRSLSDGDTIPAARTSATLQLPDFVAMFDARTRRRLGDLLRGAGQGWAGRGGDINIALEKLPTLLRDSTAVSQAVLDRPGAAARLAPSLESAAGAFEPVRDDLARGFDAQARGLRPFARSRPAIAELLDTAPDALAGTRTGLAGAGPLLIEATALTRATRRALRDAPAALGQARALLDESRRPLRRAAPLLDRLREAVPSVVGLAAELDPVLDPMARGLHDTVPVLDELAVHSCDVAGFASNWRSMLEWGVPGGGPVGPLNVFRFTFIGTPESLGRAGRNLPGGPIGTNAYPAPCEAGEERLP